MKIKMTEEQLEYFRKMGRKGGKKRMAALSPDERSELATKASKAAAKARRKAKKGK